MKEIIKVKNEIIKAIADGVCTYEEAEAYCASLGIAL